MNLKPAKGVLLSIQLIRIGAYTMPHPLEKQNDAEFTKTVERMSIQDLKNNWNSMQKEMNTKTKKGDGRHEVLNERMWKLHERSETIAQNAKRDKELGIDKPLEELDWKKRDVKIKLMTPTELEDNLTAYKKKYQNRDKLELGEFMAADAILEELQDRADKLGLIIEKAIELVNKLEPLINKLEPQEKQVLRQQQQEQGKGAHRGQQVGHRQQEVREQPAKPAVKGVDYREKMKQKQEAAKPKAAADKRDNKQRLRDAMSGKRPKK